jgi:tetratricopeptide (TPR) repeat protein
MPGAAALAETDFSFRYRRAQSSYMRGLLGIVTIILAASASFGADVRDLGVPAGWRASDYDKHGYDLLNKHDYENARRYFDAAIRTDPYMWTAYYNRAITFCMQKKWTAALQDLNSTIRLKPSFFDASFTRAAVNGELHTYKASLTDLNTLAILGSHVRNEITQAKALNNCAWRRATCPEPSIRNGELAVADSKRACELTQWKFASHIDTLAAAYAEAGDFDSAVRYEQQAISTAGKEPQETFSIAAQLFSKREATELAQKAAKTVGPTQQRYSKRLELYKQRRPYRDSGSH